MLDKQERLAVVDRATDTIEVEGQRRSLTSVQRVWDEVWHNWALSESQVDNIIGIMFEEGEIRETFSLASFYPEKEDVFS